MKKNIICPVISMVVMALVLSSCRQQSKDTTESAKGLKNIYIICKSSESPFWQTVMDGARTAGKELNVTVTTQAPVSESEVDKQIAIMENAVSTKPDAIVLAPSQSSSLVPVIEDAVAQGIPVIIIDSNADTDKFTSFLASDNVSIGAVAADEMAKAITAKHGKPEGKIACVTFMSGAASLEKRKKGFEEQIKSKYPGLEIVDFRDAMGKAGVTIDFVQNFLTKYTDLKGIFANNVHTGEETVRALDDARRKDIAVVIVDSSEQEIWGLANGFVDSMIVQQPWKMGYMGIECALKAANGEKLDKFIDTGIVSISPEMYKSGKAEEFLNPVKFRENKKEQ